MDESSSAPATPAPLPEPSVEISVPGEPLSQAPVSPAASIYDQVDYQQLIHEHQIIGMSPQELRDVFPDAHRLTQQFLGADFPEADAVGNDPHVLRSLATLGADLRIAAQAEAEYLAALPPGTKVQVAPLAGPQLDAYIAGASRGASTARR